MGEVNLENVNYAKRKDGSIDYYRWIDLSKLPRKKGNGANNDKLIIDWGNCIGICIDFRYIDIFGSIEIISYDKKNQKIKIKYNDIYYKIYSSNLIKVKLGEILKKITSKFKIEINQVFKDNKRDLVIIDRNNKRKQNGKWYKYKCNKCGFDCGEHYKNGEFANDYWIAEYSLLNGNGCACCESAPKIVVPHINSIVAKEETHWMIPYFQGGYNEAKMYTCYSEKKITFRCPDCKKVNNRLVSIRNLNVNKSIGCGKCSDGVSYLSKYIYSTLSQLNLDFQTEVKYNWNKYINPKNGKLTQASIDFVIYYSGREIPLEADGGFHRLDNNMRNQSKMMSINIDNQRDENCLKYLREETIRITDEGDIKENIVNSRLNNMFDLSIVNWTKCCEDARSSLMVKVCEYWDNKKDWETTNDLANIFKINRSTIVGYLKKGCCNYDSKEELKKAGIKGGKTSLGKVEVFKENISLGVFNNCAELERKSKDIFKHKLSRSAISNVISGKRKHHKGFTFKYVDTNKEEMA